jgi:hypothetical protein
MLNLGPAPQHGNAWLQLLKMSANKHLRPDDFLAGFLTG